MRFGDFQKQLQTFPLFAIQNLRLIFPKARMATLNTQLHQWSAQKKIIRIKNGLYVLSPEYAKNTLRPEVIAAKLYTPSYISLKYALSGYGMIPEAVFEITCVTTKPTRLFETPLGTFRYQTIKKSCFFGFSSLQDNRLPYYMANREKALLDFLYLNRHRFAVAEKTWEDLRLSNLNTLNFTRLAAYAKKYADKKVTALVHNLKKYAASS